jgi:ubiquinone biosynthesis protein UbiJ
MGCDDPRMGDCDAAQAAELIRALCDQLRELTHQLIGVDGRDVTTSSRASAKRLEAAALRRDIAEAQRHIDRLQRRYLSGDTRAQKGPAAVHPRAMLSGAAHLVHVLRAI